MILCAILGCLSVLYFSLETWKNEQSKARRAALRAQYDHHAQSVELAERESLASGELWVGDLHAPVASGIDSTTALFPPSAHSQRIFGDNVFESLGLSVNTELHQCHAGSSLCSSGGSITVRHRGKIVCVVSVGLLQIRGSKSISDYRIGWSPDSQGQARTTQEKLELLEQLAEGGLPSNHRSFDELMQAAYGFDGSTPLDSNEELRKKLVATIFRAVLSSRSRTEMTSEDV